MKRAWVACALFMASSSVASQTGVPAQAPIDRQALVARHRVVLRAPDVRTPLSVGNGSVAFTADVTGLQTYPEAYGNGTPLATLSTWAWHSSPNPQRYRLEDTLVRYRVGDREVPYADADDRDGRAFPAAAWLRANPHRLDLGRLGLVITHADGSPVPLDALTGVEQTLDLWTATLTSRFTVDDVEVRVETTVHPDQDVLATRVVSPLVRSGRVRILLAFPFPAGTWDKTRDWTQPDAHHTVASIAPDRAQFARSVDDTRYFAALRWTTDAQLSATAPHTWVLTGSTDTLACTLQVSPNELPRGSAAPDVDSTLLATAAGWARFWSTGGTIDLSGSTDPRWRELERRIVLSQFLTRLHGSGTMPPQETGLVTNSWFGKAHLEMYWWHAAHFALWDRGALLARSLDWYRELLPRARATAQAQGYAGVRWPKMVGPDGRESPSGVGTYLLWQQPHPIYLAELLWRDGQSRAVLDRYAPIVFESAAFMASFATLEADGRFHLSSPLIPAQETYGRMKATMRDPTFELAYWRWALGVAQQWRVRLGLPREPSWDRVRDLMVEPTMRDGRYTAVGVEPFTTPTDHPSMLMAYGFLPPTAGVDAATMGRTYDWVRANWQWESTWGWDYPALAMTAARLGRPADAIDALLLDVPKNRWVANGHNPQRPNLPVYLPSNGGLLAAVAMMAAGWDDAPRRHAPGFPDDGTWSVRVERVRPLP
ncbi:hypothetical protein LuPra_00750 [Luteitalea pratensis]|uniref:Glycosyl hydrolase family 65 central catalytic domain protein n=1 Tax=Luteitalea pratensis TaxID=1855912 RepID=A0A143PG91_LUTPR|nr:hypothetical protein [Luteitalea pratensis]AMY07577.1 hypothetical protein LuPra_00750 [Luteitalea pratensis]